MNNNYTSDNILSCEYATKVTIESFFGRYGWCGNLSDEVPPGNYLCIDKGKEETMIRMAIEIPDNLLEQIRLIEIYDESGFCAQYTHKKLKAREALLFSLIYVKTGTDLKIQYKKVLPCPENHPKFNRPPMETIYQEIVKIPDLEILGSTECAICLDEVTCDKYISRCHHMFHMGCIYDYAKKNERIIYLSDDCKNYCRGHGDRIKSFNCPVCRMKLENNYRT